MAGTDKPPLHIFFRGLVMALLFGPMLLVGVVLAGSALLSMVVSGWMPSRWFSSSAADWIFGGGVAGDAVNYFRFLVGALLAAASAAAIRWGFAGSAR